MMKNLVIATFPAAETKFEKLQQTFIAARPDPRAFDGCKNLDVYQEPDTQTFTLVEEWESFDHYDRYIEWRMQGGLSAMKPGFRLHAL